MSYLDPALTAQEQATMRWPARLVRWPRHVARAGVVVSLPALAATGELTVVASARSLLPYATLQALHIVAGLVLVLSVILLATDALSRRARRPLRGGAREPMGVLLLRAGYAVTLLLAVGSGLVWLAAWRYGAVWPTLPAVSAGAVLHRLATPYLYAFCLFRLLVWGRRRWHALRRYLYSH